MNHSDRHRHARDSLQRALQPTRLTPEQRARHRRLIDDALTQQPVEGGRARGKVEFAVVATALVAIIAGALTWGSLADDADDAVRETASPTIIASERATAGAVTTAVIAALPEHNPGPCAATPFATTLPDGIPRHDPAFSEWYGSQDAGLWASPINRAAFRQGPVAADTNWFAGGTSYVLWHGTSQPLQIQGRQIDGDSTFTAGPPTRIDVPSMTQWTAFQIPTPGCWEIDASSGDASMEIIVSVAPLEHRPDLLYLTRAEAARPYDPPATCSSSPAIGPNAASDWYVAASTYREGELQMSIDQAWLTAGRAEPLHITGEPLAAGADIYARQTGVAVPFQVRQRSAEGRYGAVEFPSAGCWEVAVETPARSTAFTVYVYPEECAPSGAELIISTRCRQPES